MAIGELLKSNHRVSTLPVLDSPNQIWDSEREFNRGARDQPPALGVSLSGGGNRAASFGIGVLAALHDRDLLPRVDVVSAVSGGSYALSWLLLQPYYYKQYRDPAAPLADIQQKMFRPDGEFQKYLETNARLGERNRLGLAISGAFNAAFTLAFFNAVRLLGSPLLGRAETAAVRNKGSAIRLWYRSAIQETYQTLPDPATGYPSKEMRSWSTFREGGRLATHHLELSIVPPVTFPRMRDFALGCGLPAFVFQTTVRPPRRDEPGPIAHRVFEMGAKGFGSDSCGYARWEETEGLGWDPGEDRKGKSLMQDLREKPSLFATIRNLNVASAISGAALSSTGLGKGLPRLLLNLSNLGLEYAVPNLKNQRRVVSLSDGGHSENLGALSLIRRRCRSLLIVDAEHDESFQFPSYRVLQEATRQLGLELEVPEIDAAINKGTGRGSVLPPVLTGSVRRDGAIESHVHYLKLAMRPGILGDQAEVIARYARSHPRFPQEPTTDQYFEPAQFRAYRALGYAIGRQVSIPA